MRTQLFAYCLLASVSVARGQNKLIGKPIQQPAAILKDYMSYAYYQQDYLRLSEDFKAYNSKGEPISKASFLNSMSTGSYLPLAEKLNNTTIYQLWKIPSGMGKSSAHTIAQYGGIYYRQYKREGNKMPPFKFTDLNGNTYTSANTAGKILVIKCWYLACQACREEIQELNDMITDYKDRKDVLFVSLLFDKAKPIRAFLKEHPFKYASVPNQENFEQNILRAEAYPSHFIINKKGYIVKMTTEASELAVALRKEAAKK